MKLSLLYWVVTSRIRSEYSKTETETDKKGLNPIDIGHCICLGQYEHLHTIPYNPFFIGLGLSLGLCQCEHTLKVYLLCQTETDKKGM